VKSVIKRLPVKLLSDGSRI